ncbi:MAG: DUF445 family protein [Oligoflexia bacterium]|nr:DUF445 family protein [Oligoflexia bacterium]
MNLPLSVLISVPVTGALIGWVTNYIAIKMLFRPRRPWRILGMTVIGLIPRRQAELAERISETVNAELISHKDIENVLKSPGVDAEIRAAISSQVDNMIARTVGRIPILSSMASSGISQQLKSVLVDQIHDTTPEMLERLVQKVENSLDFRALVKERIEAFELTKLEDIVYRIASHELKAIEYLGGVLGLIVGVLQLFMISLQHGPG